jgi:hypothetical protein
MNITLYIPDAYRKKYKEAKRMISPSLLFQYALDAYCKGGDIDGMVETMQTHNEKKMRDKLKRIRRIAKIDREQEHES